MNYKIVAKRMYALRKEKKVTFSRIEEETGMRFSKICRLLRGQTAPRLSEFALLCRVLEVSADELLRAEGEWEIIER